MSLHHSARSRARRGRRITNRQWMTTTMDYKVWLLWLARHAKRAASQSARSPVPSCLVLTGGKKLHFSWVPRHSHLATRPISCLRPLLRTSGKRVPSCGSDAEHACPARYLGIGTSVAPFLGTFFCFPVAGGAHPNVVASFPGRSKQRRTEREVSSWAGLEPRLLIITFRPAHNFWWPGYLRARPWHDLAPRYLAQGTSPTCPRPGPSPSPRVRRPGSQSVPQSWPTKPDQAEILDSFLAPLLLHTFLPFLSHQPQKHTICHYSLDSSLPVWPSSIHSTP